LAGANAIGPMNARGSTVVGRGNPVGSMSTEGAPERREAGARATDTLHLVVPPRVDGWWVALDPSIAHGESLLRQALYGQRYFERTFGRRSRVAWSPGAVHAAWSVPQILLNSDFDSVITGAVPWITEIEYPGREFYWEGNDGSRIFTCRPFVLPSDLAPADLVSEFRSPRLSYYRDLIALAGADVAGSPDTLEVLRRLLDSESGFSSVPVRFSEPRDAIEVVRLGIPPDSVTVWRDELVMRGTPVPRAPSRFDARRQAAVAGLQTAEAISAIVSGLPGGPAYPGDRLRRTWRQVLSDPSASMPADSGGSVRSTAALAMDDSVAATTDSIVQAEFGVLRAQMDTRSEGGASYVLFNPLGHARSGPALIEFSTPTTGGEPESARRERGLVLVDVPEVPAFGAVTIPIESDGLPRIEPSRLSPPSAGDSWMENAFLRVEIDPRTGAITRILDKANRRQALRPGGRANVLWVTDEVQAERAGPGGITAGTRQEVVRVLSLSASVSPRAATITILRQWGSSTINQELVLGRTAPFLDIRTQVVWNEVARQLSVDFEPTVSPDSATWEIPYGTISRASTPDTTAGYQPFGIAGPRWVDVSAEGYGFSILGASGNEWDYRAGNIALRLSPARSPVPPDPGSEPLTFRFALYPHAGHWSEAGTQSLAAEYQVPLLAGIELAHRGRLGSSFSFLSTDVTNVGLEWIKRAEDSEALVIRLVEWSGEAAEAEVSSACPEIAARRANHLEDPGDRLPSTRGAFRIRLRPYEIATVLLECRA